MKCWTVFIFFVLSFHSGWTQSTFNTLINFNYPAQLFTSVETDSSGIYCLGVIGDTSQYFQDGCLLAKFSNKGDLQWQKVFTSYQKPLSTFFPNLKFGYLDKLKCTGYYVQNDSVGGIIMQFDTTGTLYKNTSINTLNGIPIKVLQITNWIPISDSSTLYSIRYKTGIYTNCAIILLSNDTIKKATTIPKNGNLINYSFITTSENNYLIGNHIISSNSANKLERLNLTHIDSNLDIIDSWSSPIDSIWGAPSDLLYYNSEYAIVAFRRGIIENTNDPVQYIPSVFKIDLNSWNISWIIDIPSYGFMSSNNAEKLLVKDSQSFYICGQNWNPNFINPGSDLLGFISCINFTGNINWTRRYQILNSQINYHYLYDIKKSSDGGIVMVGESFDGSSNSMNPAQQAWILKVDSFGCLVPGCQNTTRIDEYTPGSLDIRLYPNPVSDRQVSLYVGEENPIGEMNLMLIDLNGQLLKSWTIDHSGPTTYMFEIPSVLPGMYQLLVQSGNRMWTEKLVVQ